MSGSSEAPGAGAAPTGSVAPATGAARPGPGSVLTEGFAGGVGGSEASAPGVAGGGAITTGVAGGIGGGPATGPVGTDLVVHEWGTFTSVNGSTGVLMEGLHHEEEALPEFVYGRSKLLPDAQLHPSNAAKSMENQPVGVTQKLETPVLYFYGAARKDVRVRVGFPTGVLSQWYPRVTGFGPELGAAGVPQGGFLEWLFDLAPEVSAGQFPAVAPDDIWAPSRRVGSLPVAVGAERERFIFYRGLGAFEMPLTLTVDAADRITIQNHSWDESPALFLLRVHPGGGAIVELGALQGGGSLPGIPAPITPKERNLDVYVAEAQERIAAALVRTGLYADEARAMVDTWSKSYFKSEGLRVLYVVPRAWTDRLLPLYVEPAPAAVVRTLVGRVELLAPSEEQALLAQVRDAATRTLPADTVISSLGRLAEPKLRRVLQLTSDQVVRSWTESAIGTATAMP